MAETMRTGRCLCGQVTIRAAAEPHFHACHCDICRRWGGGPMMAAVAGPAVQTTGEITRYRSSKIAERGFCPGCGTHLFYYSLPAEVYVVPVGLFDDQDGLEMSGEIYVDQQPAHYGFAGERQRMTGAEFVAAMSAQAKGG